MAIEQYVTSTVSNAKGRGTLGSSYSSGGVSLALTAGHGARFPTAGNFRVGVGSPTASDYEIMKVTARSTDTLTVVGAQENTPAGNHSSGVDVIQLAPTKLGIDAIRAEQNQIVTYANLPGSGLRTQGDQANISNGPYRAVCDGSAWQAFAMPYPVALTPPALTSFTAQDMGSATASTTTGALVITSASSSSDDIHAQYVTLPGAPYKFTALVQVTPLAPFEAGLALTDGTKYVIFFCCNGRMGVRKYNSSTSFSGNYVLNNGAGSPSETWLQIEDAGGGATNAVTFRFSPDGVNWTDVTQRDRNNFLTETRIAAYLEANNSSSSATGNGCAIFKSWLQE